MKLNLGCGFRKIEGFINIDNRGCCSPDCQIDLTDFPWPYVNDSIEYIRAFDILEHLPDKYKTVNEIYRILKPGGILEFFIPSTDGRGAFQDPFHVSFWNINSWIYYTDKGHRDLYNTKANFEIIELFDKNLGVGVIHTCGKLKAVK